MYMYVLFVVCTVYLSIGICLYSYIHTNIRSSISSHPLFYSSTHLWESLIIKITCSFFLIGHSSKICFQEAEGETRVVCSVRYRVCRCPSSLGGPIPPHLLHCNYYEEFGSCDRKISDSGYGRVGGIGGSSSSGGGGSSSSDGGGGSNGSSSGGSSSKGEYMCNYVIAETNGYSID